MEHRGEKPCIPPISVVLIQYQCQRCINNIDNWIDAPTSNGKYLCDSVNDCRL